MDEEKGVGAGDGVRTRDLLLGKQAVPAYGLNPILTIPTP